jgi:hypothetical protein
MPTAAQTPGVRSSRPTASSAIAMRVVSSPVGDGVCNIGDRPEGCNGTRGERVANAIPLQKPRVSPKAARLTRRES